jgi:sec-independent protein translocase protein TatA
MELIVVLVIALLVLGPKKLPEVGRSVGRGIREFKSSIGGDDDREHAELIAHPTEAVHAPSEMATDDPVAAHVGRS